MSRRDVKDKSLKKTRKELLRQVIIGILLYLGLGTPVLAMWPLYGLTFLLFACVCGVLLIYVVHRAFWLCLWRGSFFLLAMGEAGIAANYSAIQTVSVSYRWGVVLLISSIIVVSVTIYHLAWVIPYWRDTYEENIKYKINLKKGTFSLLIDWAVRENVKPSGKRWITLAAIVGPVIGIYLTRLGGLQTPMLALLGSAAIFIGMAVAAIEFYNFYQLLRLEKQIGKAIIFDVYERKY